MAPGWDLVLEKAPGQQVGMPSPGTGASAGKLGCLVGVAEGWVVVVGGARPWVPLSRGHRIAEVGSSPCPGQEELQRQMRETRRRCHQSTFIFDEAEKLHPGLLELLGPHLEPRAPEADRAEPPRAIFLFLR